MGLAKAGSRARSKRVIRVSMRSTPCIEEGAFFDEAELPGLIVLEYMAFLNDNDPKPAIHIDSLFSALTTNTSITQRAQWILSHSQRFANSKASYRVSRLKNLVRGEAHNSSRNK